ncbi:MAG: VOC family protein [Sphingobacteriales bacterium]|nr:VOC family protein [Sphingobacteriales bacterium]
MKDITPYLTFNGTCRQAMTFYKDILGGDLELMDFASSPMDVPDEAKNYIMHAILTSNGVTLMASDTMPNQPVTNGNSVSLSINCQSTDEINHLFNSLSDGGQITMPLEDTFWGSRFGMLTDKFGTCWMFNYDYPQA